MDPKKIENTPIDIDQTTTPQASYSKRASLLTVVLLLIIVLLSGVCVYLFRKVEKKATQSSQTAVLPTDTTLPTPLVQPLSPTITNIDSLGTTTISFVESGKDIYLKHETSLYDQKVTFANTSKRIISSIYAQDENRDPKEITDLDSSKYSWIEIIKEPIVDVSNAKSILITDRLFSFKRIPNSRNFIFVEEWYRSAGQNVGTWMPYQFGRDIYMYDRNSNPGSVTKIITLSDYPKNKGTYTFPKISEYSKDGNYVSIELFGCWNCGGHQPEILLLDLKTFKTKNIGKAIQFTWGDNGMYTYKEYVVIDCQEPQPGECSQDPSNLPLKTGQM